LQISARWGIAEWASDGLTAFVAGKGNVHEVDIATGNVSQTYKVPIEDIMVLSSIQKLVASRNEVNRMFEIQVAAFDESTSRTLLSSGRDCHPAGFWKRQVFVACQGDSGMSESSSLYLVDVDSGTIRGLNVNLPRVKQVRVRPDDQAIAIISGITEFGATFTLKLPSK